MTVEEIVAFADQIEGEGNARIGRMADPCMCTMTREELTSMAKRLVQVPHGGVVVEIGVYCGRSAALALMLQAEMNLDITLIDNWSWNAPDSQKAFWKFIQEKFPNTPFTMREMTSHEARELWTEGKEIDFIHIDGCHDYFWIEKDCAMWMPLVKVGGVAQFHDYAVTEILNYCGVTQAVDEHCNTATGWTRAEETFRLATRVKNAQMAGKPLQPLLEEMWAIYGRPALKAMGR